jgi:hypothetical protein
MSHPFICFYQYGSSEFIETCGYRSIGRLEPECKTFVFGSSYAYWIDSDFKQMNNKYLLNYMGKSRICKPILIIEPRP